MFIVWLWNSETNFIVRVKKKKHARVRWSWLVYDSKLIDKFEVARVVLLSKNLFHFIDPPEHNWFDEI